MLQKQLGNRRPPAKMAPRQSPVRPYNSAMPQLLERVREFRDTSPIREMSLEVLRFRNILIDKWYGTQTSKAGYAR